MLNKIKKLIEILNKPRFIEFTYGTYEDELRTSSNTQRVGLRRTHNEDRYDQPIIKDLEIDYAKIALNLNKQNTKELIRAYIEKRAEQDGLLLTEKQLKYDTEQTYRNYKNAGFIDLNNNLKIGVEEGLKEIINK